MQKNLLAFDCGNSTLRTILCRFDGEKIVSEDICSEPNEIIKIGDFFYWDMLHIFSFMKKGLEMAAAREKIHACGVCTWGIDFMLFDEKDNMLSNALCYRNTMGGEEMDRIDPEEQKKMFYRTGILCDKINTVFTLAGMKRHIPAVLNNADKILLVPDVLTYFMTGEMIHEPSEFSTSQLMDVRTMSLSKEQCEVMGIDPGLFRNVARHGQTVGYVKREILDDMKIDYDIPFICTPSHDTASAVFGIPCESDEYLFVSSGTWALIGAQLKEPVITDAAMEGKLTNEMGAFGRTTLLKNSIGMFITQRLRAECRRDLGYDIGWPEYTAQADDFKGEVKLFDVNHPDFFNPVHMAKAINKHLHGNEDYNWPEIVASVNASLAESYVVGLKAVMAATGRNDKEVYVVGGGAKNGYINQACADKLGIKVITCAMEVSSLGNAAVQLSGICPEYTYEDLKKIIKASLVTKCYEPKN